MSIFKSTFPKFIQEQIKVRQDVISKKDRSIQDLTYLNSKNCWIRLSSAVDIREGSGMSKYFKSSGNKLASDNILQGGTLYNDGSKLSLKSGLGNRPLAAYNPDKSEASLGIRPMPGITNVSIKSKSAYGSLREATINFQCWSIEQLEKLEVLYMRPGYTALLEWGWSPYLDNSGKLNNNIVKYDLINNNKDQQTIFKDLKNKSELYSGNYDGFYGYVKNFSWKANSNGGYDCTTTLISIGEILESLKINFASSNSNFPFDLSKLDKSISDNIKKEYSVNQYKGILLWIINTLLKNKDSSGVYSVLKYEKISSSDDADSLDRMSISIIVDGFIWNYSSEEQDSEGISSLPKVFIPFRTFIDIINDVVIPNDDKGKKLGKFLLGVDGEKNECLANPLQMSVDPTTCLITYLPNSPYVNKFRLFNNAVDKSYKAEPFFANSNGSRGYISDIWVNLNEMISMLDTMVNSSNDKSVKIFDYIKDILRKMGNALGNINNFNIITLSENKALIVDINYLEKSNDVEPKFELETSGTKTIVRNYSLDSQIFPNQAAMISIAAQNGGGNTGENTFTFGEWNQGLEDRIITVKVEPTQLKSVGSSLKEIYDNINVDNLVSNPYDDIKSNYLKGITDKIFKLDTELFSKIKTSNIDLNNISQYSSLLHDLIMDSYKIFPSSTSNDYKAKAILPLKLSITIDGLSGFIIGQIFKIPKYRLPKGYKNVGIGENFDIGFIITGISHELRNNDWITTLDTQTCILDTTMQNNLTRIPFKPYIDIKNQYEDIYKDFVQREKDKFEEFDQALKTKANLRIR